MPGKSAAIAVSIKADADFDAARKDIEASFAKIDKASKESVAEIEAAFAKADVGINVDETGLKKATADFDSFTAKLKAGSEVELTVDESDLKQAFDLANKLGELTERVTITADADELKQAQALAQSLRSFTGRINLDVQGQADLREALGLAENLDQLRRVKVEVQGKEDLQRALQIADDLERKRTIPVDAQLGDLKQLDSQLAAAGAEGGEGFGANFESSLGGVDLSDVGRSMAGSLTDTLSAAGPWGAAAGAVAAVFADSFLDGFKDQWNAHRNDLFRTVTSGLDDAALKADGQVAGKAYADGFGESLSQLKADADTLQASLAGLKGFIPEENLKQAEALSQLMGIEIPDSVRLVQRAVNQGLVPDVTSGFNAIGQAARDFSLDQDDLLETFTEQASTFAQLGITMPRAIQLMGQAFTSGLIPQLDQTGELFEEFVSGLNSGGAREAIEDLGLSWAEITGLLQDGKGAEAVDQVVAAIQRIPDPAARSAAAVGLFGENLSLSADKDALLTLIGTADEFKAIEPVATNAAKAVDESATSFSRLQIQAEQAGGSVSRVLESFLAGGQTQAAGNVVQELEGGWKRLSSAIFGADEVAQDIVPTFAEARNAAGDAAEGIDGVSVAAEDAADQLHDAAMSTEELTDRLGLLFNFSADQLLREIADQGDALAESLKNGAGAAVGMNGAIDITRKGGADLQAQLEDLNDSLVQAAIKFSEGSISADQFRAVQVAVEGQFGQVTKAAGVTTGEVEGLRQKYIELPDTVRTTLDVQTSQAQAAIAELQRTLNGIKDKTITITERHNAVYSVLSNTTQAGRASGGPVKAGQVYMVGEQGQELFLPKQDGTIIDATSTRALLDKMAPTGGSGWTGPAWSAPAGNSKTVNFNGPIVVDKGRDVFADLLLYEQIYSAA